MKNVLFLISLLTGLVVQAQPSLTDSALRKNDSLVNGQVIIAGDTVLHQPATDSIKPLLRSAFTADSFRYQQSLFFSFTNPIRYTISKKGWEGKEVIFYSVIALLIAFALIKNLFNRYLADLFSSYFRTTLRQRQIKEQLVQNPLPSLLFNVFFILSTSFFSALLLQHFQLNGSITVELLAAYSAAGLTLLYGGKFVLLKFFGWVFQMTDATDAYIFIVFSTNKIIGVCLLPFTILLAFSYAGITTLAVTGSLILLGALFAYRYFLSYLSINQMARINFFHFLLYLAAFEVLPLLLINKLLFGFLREIA